VSLIAKRNVALREWMLSYTFRPESTSSICVLVNGWDIGAGDSQRALASGWGPWHFAYIFQYDQRLSGMTSARAFGDPRNSVDHVEAPEGKRIRKPTM
jgi:hypothetical protein